MSFEVVWDFPALFTFYEIHWRTGAAIDAEVMRFAASRAAKIAAAPIYHLRVSGHDVFLSVDRPAATVTVLRIFRRR